MKGKFWENEEMNTQLWYTCTTVLENGGLSVHNSYCYYYGILRELVYLENSYEIHG